MPPLPGRRRWAALLFCCIFLAAWVAVTVAHPGSTGLRSLVGALLTAVLAAPLLWLCFRPRRQRRARLMAEMDALAEREFSGRLPAESFKELAGVADRINRWAALWEERQARSLHRQHQEQTILGAMLEGVIAVDHQHRITHLNLAATRLLQVEPERAAGRLLEETVRHPDLHRLAGRVCASGEAAEAEIQWHGSKPCILQVRASPMRSEGRSDPGAVLVLHDITNVRRLEKAQRDFVANVSHEFKTPLTSLKGFVETLQDGALDDPADARRFVGIMGRQVDRLQSLVEDVLSLSRLEQEAGNHPTPRQDHALQPILHSALEACLPAAQGKTITLDLTCEPNARACVNPAMLEQAAINLIDNAIKYSDAGTRVDIRVVREGDAWRLAVHDQGPGIDAQHLPLIFDRFYRVDKSRSRKAGGTGLGLSIVRHIALAHDGRVDVQSEPGRGSVFSLILPGRSAAA